MIAMKSDPDVVVCGVTQHPQRVAVARCCALVPRFLFELLLNSLPPAGVDIGQSLARPSDPDNAFLETGFLPDSVPP